MKKLKDNKLIKQSADKGFVSRDYIVEVNEDYYYLWMCELQKWLREEHNIYIQPSLEMIVLDSPVYVVSIFIKNDKSEFGITRMSYTTGFRSYEDALEAGLYQGLKLIKD